MSLLNLNLELNRRDNFMSESCVQVVASLLPLSTAVAVLILKSSVRTWYGCADAASVAEYELLHFFTKHAVT